MNITESLILEKALKLIHETQQQLSHVAQEIETILNREPTWEETRTAAITRMARNYPKQPLPAADFYHFIHRAMPGIKRSLIIHTLQHIGYTKTREATGMKWVKL